MKKIDIEMAIAYSVGIVGTLFMVALLVGMLHEEFTGSRVENKCVANEYRAFWDGNNSMQVVYDNSCITNG